MNAYRKKFHLMAKSKLDRLNAAHTTVAKLVVLDRAYLPIFQRLEAELAAEEARVRGDAIAYARALVAAQRAHDEQPNSRSNP